MIGYPIGATLGLGSERMSLQHLYDHHGVKLGDREIADFTMDALERLWEMYGPHGPDCEVCDACGGSRHTPDAKSSAYLCVACSGCCDACGGTGKTHPDPAFGVASPLDLIRELRDALGLPNVAMAQSPSKVWADTLNEVRRRSMVDIKRVEVLHDEWRCNEALAEGATLLSSGLDARYALPKFVVGWRS